MLTVAAKQDAFEESIRLKNQFRNLDEDEVEFLDSILESTRAREEAVKKETREQLELFRRQQEEADRTLMTEGSGVGKAAEVGASGSPTGEESLWAVNARKRKRMKEKEPNKLAKQRKQSLPLESSISITTNSLNHSDSTVTTLSDEYNDSPGLAGSPSKLAEVSKGTSSQATAAKPSERPPSVSDKQLKQGHPNLGLGSYDSDDDE